MKRTLVTLLFASTANAPLFRDVTAAADLACRHFNGHLQEECARHMDLFRQRKQAGESAGAQP